MSRHTAHPLPDGRQWIAEGHNLTAAGLAALHAGRAEQSNERVWTWSTATEGDQAPGG